jgi:SPP1 Gp6-like portal protein
VIIDIEDVPKIANQILRIRQSEQVRLRHISKYMEGKHDPPYAPRGVNSEYRWIMKKSKRNFLPLVVSVISQNLHVDGYKPSGATAVETASSSNTEPAWKAFEANRMISRQHGVHRAVIEYGAAYVLVLPGELSTDEELPGSSVPVIRPVSPRRMTALYADDVDDEWPQVAIEVRRVSNAADPSKQQLLVQLYDENTRYTLTTKPGVTLPESFSDLAITEVDDPNLGGQQPISSHGLGICPVVRFLYEVDLDGDQDCSGEIEPIIPLQDQINFDTFNCMMSEQYQAFRQRWVTGMAPVDVEGREQAPFRPGVDRVWAAEDPATKFGEFGEGNLGQYLDTRESGIRHMSTITQIPPYHLLGQVANLSAEALAAARDGLDRKVDELQSNMTDPWRNVFRLTALAANDKAGWNDTNGQIVWRDTSAKAFAATIDALGKAAQMLDIPVEELWKRIPGATADDVNSWIKAKQQQDAEDMANQAVQNAMGAAGTAQPGQPANVPQPRPAGQPKPPYKPLPGPTPGPQGGPA